MKKMTIKTPLAIAFSLIFFSSIASAQLIQIDEHYYIFQDSTRSVKSPDEQKTKGYIPYFSENFMVISFPNGYFEPVGHIFCSGQRVSGMYFDSERGPDCQHNAKYCQIIANEKTGYISCDMGLQNGIAVHTFDLKTGDRRDINFPDSILNKLPIPEDNYGRDRANNVATYFGSITPTKLNCILMPDNHTFLYYCNMNYYADQIEKINYPVILYDAWTETFQTVYGAAPRFVLADQENGFYVFYMSEGNKKYLAYFDFNSKKLGWMGTIKDEFHKLYVDEENTTRHFLVGESGASYVIQNNTITKVKKEEFYNAKTHQVPKNVEPSDNQHYYIEYGWDPFNTSVRSKNYPILSGGGYNEELDYIVDGVASNGKQIIVFTDTSNRSNFYIDRMAQLNGQASFKDQAKAAKIQALITDLQGKLYACHDDLTKAGKAFETCHNAGTDCAQEIMEYKFRLKQLDEIIDSYINLLNKYKDEMTTEYYKSEYQELESQRQNWHNSAATKMLENYR